MKKVLILGGSGFIGTNLSKFLLKSGYEVYSFDLIKPQSNYIEGVNYIEGDFFDDIELKSAIKDKDYIIHAISTINPGNSNDCYVRGYEKDFLQTIKLCNLLIGRNTRLIFLSSGGTVYGQHMAQPINESVLPQPINHYGNIKLCMENTIRTFNYQMHIKMLIVRISNPYGPGQDHKRGVGFIDAVLKNVMRNEPTVIWGDGNNVRDYIYIENVCDMIVSLMEYNGEYDTFNISSGIGTSQNTIIEIVKEMGMNPQVTYLDKRSVDVRKIVLDNSRIKTVWKKELLTLREGIKMYYKYLTNCYESEKVL